MNEQGLQRLIQAAKRIGGPLIVTDASGDEPVVIVPLHEYESMLGTAPAPEIPVETDAVKEDAGFIEQGGEIPEISQEVFEELGQVTEESIPVQPVVKAQEAPSIPGEEQFYLEPIE